MFRRSPHDAEILRLAVPALGALIAEPLYVLTDTAIVGHLGTDELAGVAIAGAVLLTVHALLIFLAYGTTGLVGRKLGAGDIQGAAVQGVQALWLAVVLGIGTSVGLALTGDSLVDLFQPTPAVREAALTYLNLSLFGLTSLLLVLAGTGYLRGQQDTRTPLVVALGSALANLVIELVFVYPLGLGVAGSAWSTVIAQTGAAIIYLFVIGRSAGGVGASLCPHLQSLLVYAGVGARLMVRTAALRGSLLLAAALASRIGTTAVASHQISMEIWGLLALALDAVAIAGQALVARLLGAGDATVARQASQRMIELSVMVGSVFGLLVLIARVWLPAIFSSDPEVQSLTAFLLLFVALMQPMNGVVFALDGILIGAGDLTFLAKAMVIAFAAFVVAALAARWADFGIGWLWAAIWVFMIARAIPLWRRFQTGKWATIAHSADSSGHTGP
jgi:putative MATE family efflux protein